MVADFKGGVDFPKVCFVAKICKFFVRIFTQPLEKKSIMCYNLTCSSVLFFSLREWSSILKKSQRQKQIFGQAQ